MRVIIIDPLLKNQSGHCYFYTSAVYRELEQRGIPVSVYGNAHADESCRAIGDFYPRFEGIIDKVFDLSFSPGKILALVGDIRTLKQQFVQVLRDDVKLRRDDILFAHTFYIFELLSFALALGEIGKSAGESNGKIVLVYRFRYFRRSTLLTLFFIILYKLISNVLLKRFKEVSYATDSELLKSEYERIIDRKLTVYPIPVYPVPPGSHAENETLRKNLVISYTGGTRYNKGFDIFAGAVELLLKEEMKVTFNVQIDVHSQLKAEEEKVSAVAQKIVRLAASQPRIRVLSGILSQEDYYRVLRESDMVVLPYRDEAFKSATSNIFVETVILEKLPIVSGNTWMEYELKRFGLAELAFKNEDPRDLVRVIRAASENGPPLREKIRAMSEAYARFHRASRLVDMLTGEASHEA